MSVLRVVVLADTHLRGAPTGVSAAGMAGGARVAGRAIMARLPPLALDHLARADVILHAGDVLDAQVLEVLAEHAPTYAVLGNNDRTLVGRLPATRTLDLAGVRVAMVHDSGPARGRAARLHGRFGDAALVVFGHSHAPLDEEGVDGQRLFNPGSPTQRRAQPYHTLGILDIADGVLVDHRIVVLD